MKTQNNELEVMRQQLAILNKKLDSQEIVNDRLMRQTMKHKMSWIKHYVWAEIIAVPFLIIFFFGMTVIFNLSFGPLVYLSVMLVISVVIDYKVNMMKNREFLDGNLTETAVRLTTMKKRRLVSELAQIPFILVWMVWFIYDMYRHFSGGVWDMSNPGLTGGFIGAIIGAVAAVPICFFLVRKMQRTNDEVIRQIQELTKE